MLQLKTVKCHPKISDIFAVPYVESELPIYVHEFNKPDTKETLLYFLKCKGIMQISMRLTPCMQPVITVDNATDNAGLKDGAAASIAAAKKPIPNMLPAQISSLLSLLSYSHSAA